MSHPSLPVRLPDVAHLTNPELSALRSRVAFLVREARRKSNALIAKHPDLKGPWMAMISSKLGAHDHDEVLAAFEHVLLRYPEAYLAYAYVTSLFALDEEFRAELGRRSVPLSTKKKRAVETALPPPAPPRASAVLETEDRPPWEFDED